MQPRIVSYFVRHGETAANARNEFRGPLNIPLDEKGIQQAEGVRGFLKNITLGTAYASDMDRVLHTADIALKDKDISPSVTPDLRSWNVGHFAGQPKPENQFQIKYYQENPDEKIPGGESLNEFRKRVQPRIKTAIMAGIHTQVPSIVFTHSSVIHELSHILYGDHQYIKVKPGGVVGVAWDGKQFKAKTMLGGEHGEQGYGA